MDIAKTKQIFREVLSEIEAEERVAATNKFPSLRAVDAKIREVRIIIRDVAGIPPDLIQSMESDQDFQANSRRIRLETLAHYVRTALRFLESGVYQGASQKILPPPHHPIFTSSRRRFLGFATSSNLAGLRCRSALVLNATYPL